MKIINYGENYEIYPDDLKTFDQLPAATYKVVFSQMSGFSLIKIDNFETIEEKIYGNHEEKIDKVLHSYDRLNRSLGIILSGDKGMGKSLFVQLLAKETIAKGMPVIMVTKPYPGVADFIEKINQECLVIFDEFEKVFGMDSEKGESQDSLLGLFDGTSQKKRMYAITVNHLRRLSEFMVSRTGRFHYHIRFTYPTPEEIELYLTDKLDPQYHAQIGQVIAFSTRVKLNYDSLRAIAFEMNGGYSFGSAIGDLNILSTDRQAYDVYVNFSNGLSSEVRGNNLNLFAETLRLDGSTDNGDYFHVTFNTSDIQTTGENMAVDGKDVKLHYHDGEEDSNVRVESITIKLQKDDAVNYKMVGSF